MVGENRHRVQITLGDDMFDRLESVCRALGITKSSAVAVALAEWLKKNEGQGAPESE